MNAQLEQLSSVTKKLTVEVSAEEFRKEETNAFNKLRSQVVLPGFRKGKAPASAVKRAFGERVRADAVNEIIHKTYTQAIEETKAEPVNEPSVSIEKFDEDGALVYTATIEVRPEVKPQGYAGLALKKEQPKVDEKAIDERIENFRSQCASLEPAEEGHKAASGDMVQINFSGKIDGELFEGGTAENFPLILGSGRMIPGFEDGIIGAAAGEERTIEVHFPETYHAAALAGKAATFDIKVLELKRRNLPEVNDDFAKQLGLESVDELRKKLAESLGAEDSARIEREFKRKLIDLILAANEFEVPPSVVERQKEHSINRTREDLTKRGLDPVAIGIDSPAFAEEAKSQAVRTVRWVYLRDAIAEAEGISVQKEDIDKRIEEIAKADGRPVESIQAFFEKPQHMMSLFDTLLEEKTMAAILAKATVEEVDAETWAAWRGEEDE
jgi:trigger factor